MTHLDTTFEPSLDGKTALVTGGASGIGAALARRFAERGAAVVIADIDPAGRDLAESIGGVFVAADVSRPEDDRAAVEAAVDRFGALDIAALNAGIGEGGALVDGFDIEAYRRLVAVNLDGVVFGMHAALERFTERGAGAILVTASLAGITSSPLNPLYAATKHAVIGLVRAVAPSVIDRGITVNALCPTFIDTPILQGFTPQLRAMGLAVLEPARVADVAEAVLASGTTGKAWPVVPHGDLAPWPFAEPPTLMSDPDQPPPEMPS